MKIIIFLMLVATAIVCGFAVALEEPTWPAILLISFCFILVLVEGWLVWIEPREVIEEEIELKRERVIDNYSLIRLL